MAIRPGDEAPDFTAETTEGTITFHDWKTGAWAVLFTHPADYTPVCTTQPGCAAALQGEFDKRDVKAIAMSVDPIEYHRGWAGDIGDVGGTDLNFPIIADPSRAVSEPYDMIHPGEGDTSTVRSVFIIDPTNKVRLTLTYPKSVGRNFDEILRVIDALQLDGRAYRCRLPPTGTPGDRVVVSATDADRRRGRAFRRRRRGQAVPALDHSAVGLIRSRCRSGQLPSSPNGGGWLWQPADPSRAAPRTRRRPRCR